MNKQYDAILVLGRGINPDGEIPESAKATIRTAIDLWKKGIADRIIFSGKWTYNADFIPPTTEAKVMAAYAESIGLDPEKAVLEEKSETTVTNLCEVKKQILMPRGWHNIALISIDILQERMGINADMVFGDDVSYKFFTADYTYPEPRYSELKAEEKMKVNGEVQVFFKGIEQGDDETIFNRAVGEIERRKKNIKIKK